MIRPRVLAIASNGGHWIQLLRLASAWDGCEVHYATTSPDCQGHVARLAKARGQAAPGYHVVTDANRWQKFRLIRQAVQVFALILRLRPQVIITTGASVGYFAIVFGRLLGARTLWLDSIANAKEPSLSGARAGPLADLWLTQWPELARPGGPSYRGQVL
ncbi:glucuronosyltransferase [Thermaurantiacus sp.]